MNARRDELAKAYGQQDHEKHSCNGISLHPIREKSFAAGYDAGVRDVIEWIHAEAKKRSRFEEATIMIEAVGREAERAFFGVKE